MFFPFNKIKENNIIVDFFFYFYKFFIFFEICWQKMLKLFITVAKT